MARLDYHPAIFDYFLMNYSANYHLLAKDNAALGKPPADHSGPEVLRVANEHWAPDFHIARPHMRPAMIILIRSGTLVYGDGTGPTPGNEHEIGPGSVLTYHHDMSRFQRVTDQDGCRLQVVACIGPALSSLLTKHLGGPLVHIPHAGSVQSLFDECYHAARRAGPQVHSLCAHLVEALVLRLSEIQQVDLGSLSLARQQFLRYRRILWQDADQLPTVKVLANRCGVSQSHLTRLFQRFDTETPAQMLRRLRLERVRDLLEHGDHAIAHIADLLAFEDPYTMSRSFKRHYGQSPSAMR